jgi:hypothetical protein
MGVRYVSMLCIVPCGKRKIWDRNPSAGPTPAKDVYIGPFAMTCIRYAQAYYPQSYYILSAKYGFLKPDDLIPRNYNVSFKFPETNPISIERLKESAVSQGLFDYQQIVAIAGNEYLLRINVVFRGLQVYAPLSEYHNMFEMIAGLNRAIINGHPLALNNAWEYVQ